MFNLCSLYATEHYLVLLFNYFPMLTNNNNNNNSNTNLLTVLLNYFYAIMLIRKELISLKFKVTLNLYSKDI